MVYMKLMEWGHAMTDCDKAIELATAGGEARKGVLVKAIARKAEVQYFLKVRRPSLFVRAAHLLEGVYHGRQLWAVEDGDVHRALRSRRMCCLLEARAAVKPAGRRHRASQELWWLQRACVRRAACDGRSWLGRGGARAVATERVTVP